MTKIAGVGRVRPEASSSSSWCGVQQTYKHKSAHGPGTKVFRVCTNVFMHFYDSAGRLHCLKTHLSHLSTGAAGLCRCRPTRLLLQPLMADTRYEQTDHVLPFLPLSTHHRSCLVFGFTDTRRCQLMGTRVN